MARLARIQARTGNEFSPPGRQRQDDSGYIETLERGDHDGHLRENRERRFSSRDDVARDRSVRSSCAESNAVGAERGKLVL